MIKIPIYVSTNNKHWQCLQVFTHLFNKFLPQQELRILGYDTPNFVLPDNCKFISMGTQGPVNEWSTDLRKFFKNCKDKFFIYGTEDVFIYKAINVSFINYLIDIIELNNNIGRVNLVDATEGNNCHLIDSPHYDVELLNTITKKECGWDDWELYIQKPSSDYSLTTQLSIWNKEFLLRYLNNGLTPWDFERQSHIAKHDPDYKILMLYKNFPIYKKEGYSLGTWTNKTYWFDLLNSDIKKQII
tara:strand:+ start:2942 stop:3673 length:732 start_codon:yes stop_codon:yes gene_type:complete